MNTNVVITVNGRESSFTDLRGDFENQAVEFPADEWKGAFTEKPRGEPDKKKAKVDAGAAPAASPAKSSSNAVLSSALRKRLAEKTSPKKV